LKKYEAIVILNERKVDNNGQAYIQKMAQKLKELGAEDIKQESLGRKQFARAIGKKTSGIYWYFTFQAEPDKIAPFKSLYKLEEAVIRMVVYNYEVPENLKTLDMAGAE